MPLIKWVELRNNNQIKEMPLKSQAQTVILHPDEMVITLKAETEGKDSHFIQIFNLTRKKKLNSFTFPQEKVDFWCWLDAAELAIVTAKAV